MKVKNSYLKSVIEKVAATNAGEPEFVQAVTEVLSSLEPMVEKNEALYRKHCILERMVEPDRIISFRVVWEDADGDYKVNRGYRVQFNNAIGPYKGGLRFHPTVNQGILKFLGFEQTFKNSLTGLPMGGAKGGSDFNPVGKTDIEIMRFCHAFMDELYRHIGPNLDVPAGDIGVGGREIGYLFGRYKKIRGQYENGVLTGKGMPFGGSLIRPEATGFGAVYFLEEVLKRFGEEIKGKTFALSGYGNVTWGACLKINELGGKVVSLSGSHGYVYDPDGVSGEKVDYLLEMRASTTGNIKDYAKKYNLPFHEGEKPWGNVKADVYMPCATQNEITLDDAKKIVAAKVKFVNEVSNMSTTLDAIDYLRDNGVIICPSKAANAGGVATSGLEMTQNSERLTWTKEEVDGKLRVIMKNIYKQITDVIDEFGLPYDLVEGANIAGFKKVADAMIAEGIY